MPKTTKTIEKLDASISRWKTRLRRAVNMIDKLEKQRKRMAARPPSLTAGKPVAEARAATPVPPPIPPSPVEAVAAPGNLDIPEFLRRSRPDAAGEAIAAEIAERSKAKARGRIAKLKAKKSGDTKKMPLSGREALAAIRSGD